VAACFRPPHRRDRDLRHAIEQAMRLSTKGRYAVMAMTGFEMTPMSLELKVSFFAPARPGPVFAEAWVEQKGKSTCFVEGRLKDGKGAVLAKASSTIRLIPRHKVEQGSRDAVAG
jgi:acyl-coenzyme A thioesterase PaaI-like protein